MSSRDAILGRIRTALAGSPPVAPPEPDEVWPRETPAPQAMADRFAAELKEVHGETIRCASMAEAQQRLADLIQQDGWQTLSAAEGPLCRELLSALPAERVAWLQDGWTARDMAQLSASVIEPEYLLADTGSSVVSCSTAPMRLLCYLPPACVIIATTKKLVEHLPAAWEGLAARAADPAARGEIVLITGPSRTADIEKILILGVHGPKRLVVLVVG